MSSASASIASGVLDSISAGILLYAATVELIVSTLLRCYQDLPDSQAHEFIFNHFYHTCSWKRVIFSLGCFALGAGIMALLGMSAEPAGESDTDVCQENGRRRLPSGCPVSAASPYRHHWHAHFIATQTQHA